MTVTTKRIANGFFDVYYNGEKTEWRIINGDLGSSGNGANMYGIYTNAEKPRWIGSLAKCKKTLDLTFRKGGV